MRLFGHFPRTAAAGVFYLGLLSSCIHRKYETPITKNTQQPDKVLFDKAMKDIEHGRYEVARISLNTLINTYESSEYLAKAKLAIADSWFREGGLNGMAQAEAEYKDFKLFYPSMAEAAEAQNKVCQIHFRQMNKADRDQSQALRAEDECRQLLLEYPNSKFAPEAEQRLRDIQEAEGEHEFRVGTFYHQKGANPAAANRLQTLVDQYPLYSRSDEALYEAGDSYSKMGPTYRQKSGQMFGRIVESYPLSARAEDAKSRLEEMELPVPQANRAAYDRMKWEQENRNAPSLMSRAMGVMRNGPDVSHAARSGQPAMESLKPTIPASVPAPTLASNGTGAGAGATGTTDVGVSTVSDSNPPNSGADTRQGESKGGTKAAAATAMPSNHDADMKDAQKRQAKAARKKKKNKAGDQQNGQPASTSGGKTVQVDAGTQQQASGSNSLTAAPNSPK